MWFSATDFPECWPMIDGTDSQTSTTLLRRLRDNPADESAWGDFVERYGRLIYSWCRRWGLQEADAEDVTQNVLAELVRQMRTFVYDPAGSFRGWLRTIAYRAWCRFREGRQRQGNNLAMLGWDEACEDFIRQLEEESERELLEKAMALVRLRVQPHTWEAFRLLALEGRSGAEVAGVLGMKVGAAFVARSKVQRMLREEIHRLDGEGERP
jgi:RNA polymerase sigma-70 factor (ECF subfamily)